MLLSRTPARLLPREIADEAVAEQVRQLGRDLVAYADVSRYPETVSRGRRQTGRADD